VKSIKGTSSWCGVRDGRPRRPFLLMGIFSQRTFRAKMAKIYGDVGPKVATLDGQLALRPHGLGVHERTGEAHQALSWGAIAPVRVPHPDASKNWFAPVARWAVRAFSGIAPDGPRGP